MKSWLLAAATAVATVWSNFALADYDHRDPIGPVAIADAQMGGAAADRLHTAPGESFTIQLIAHLGSGDTLVRLNRLHDGLPVVDDVIKLTYSSNNALRIAVTTLTGPLGPTRVTPSITAPDAERLGMASFPHLRGKSRGPASLVLFLDPSRSPHLAWKVRIDGFMRDQTPSAFVAYVSATDGKVLGTDDDTRTLFPTSSAGLD